MTDYEEIFAAAQDRVQARIGFYKHAALFAGGLAVLAGVDVLTTPGLVWFPWPMAAWGILLGVHGKKARKAGKIPASRPRGGPGL